MFYTLTLPTQYILLYWNERLLALSGFPCFCGSSALLAIYSATSLYLELISQGRILVLREEWRFISGKTRLHSVTEEIAGRGCLWLQPAHPTLEILGPIHERYAKKPNFHPVITKINNDEELFPTRIQSTAMTSYPIYKGENTLWSWVDQTQTNSTIQTKMIKKSYSWGYISFLLP